MNNLLFSFSPWVAFLLGVRFGSVYWGAAIGAVVALVVLIRAVATQGPSVRRHRGRLFRRPDRPAGGHPSERHRHLGTMGPGGGPRLPDPDRVRIGPDRQAVHRAYAREQAPAEVWHSPVFHELNRRISLVFGLAFLVGTAS